MQIAPVANLETLIKLTCMSVDPETYWEHANSTHFDALIFCDHKCLEKNDIVNLGHFSCYIYLFILNGSFSLYMILSFS